MFKQILTRTSRKLASLEKTKKNLLSVPEPKGLPIVGTFFDLVLSGSGTHLHKYIDKRHKELGPIFQEKIGPVRAVFISDPNYQRSVYACEGRYPKHVIPEAWTLYNKIHQCRRGILFMDGEEWHHYRKILNVILLKNINEEMVIKCFRNISKKLIEKWSHQKIIKDLNTTSYSLAVESMLAILIGNGEHPEFIKLEKEIKEFGNHVNQIFVETSGLKMLPANLAKNLKLPVWNRFENAVTETLNDARNLFEKIMPISLECDGILQKMVEANIEPEVLQRIIVDLILGAGDTSANTFQWSLYLLCRHQEIQLNLSEQLRESIEPSQDYNHPLLRGILRETLRLYPVAPFITRYMPEDCDLGGYYIKKGTLVILSLYTSSRDPNNFPEPNRFWPERWNRISRNYEGVNNPSGSLPFAFGVRSCVGRKIAELLLKISLSEILQNFEIDLQKDEEIEMILKLLAVPSKPIELVISKRY